MFKGLEVTVWRAVPTGGTDKMGEPAVTWVPETVGNVLWHPSSAARLADGTRPDGTEDTLTVHFPKTYTASLVGCQVEIGGVWWSVIGDPQGWMPSLVPGPWNRQATVRKVDG